MIEEDLDDALAHLATAEGTPKAALIRRFVRDAMRPLPPLREDPLWEMVGASSFEYEHHDDVLYPR